MSASWSWDRFQASARRHPDSLAIGNEQLSWTFAELEEQAGRWATLLSDGGPGCQVMIAARGGPQFTAVTLGALAAGAVVIPVPAESTREEALRLFQVVEPHLLVVESRESGQALVQAMPPGTAAVSLEEIPTGALPWPAESGARPGLPDGTAFLQFTSGSSGSPKGILLSQDNLRAYLDHQGDFLRRFTGQQVFCPVPQAHSYGGTVTLEHLFHGTGVHLANRFLPAADVARMTELGCRGLLAPPSYVRMLLRLGGLRQGSLPSLEWLNLGTAPVDQDLVRGLREARPGWTLFVRYGLSETMGYVARLELSPGQLLEHKGLVGSVIPGIEVAAGLPAPGATEPGVIRVRGPVVAPGQLVGRDRVEPLADAEGWFSTGDLACQDEEGRLHLRGRRSSFLKRGGFRINPFEIEDLLAGEPGVGEVVVVGLPDPLMGERIVAVVEPAPGRTPPQPTECLDLCRRRLSAFKIPQECRILDRIPRTRSGKPDRPALVARLQAER